VPEKKRGTRPEKEMPMQRKTVRLVVRLALVLLTAPLAAHAQPATKVYRIGVVRPATASATASDNAAFTHVCVIRMSGGVEGERLCDLPPEAAQSRLTHSDNA
jgi:hypothetical protein